MIDLKELENLHVEIEVAPPGEYVDGNLPMLVPEGTYDLVLTEVEPTRDRESGEPDGRGFVLTAEVAAGEYAGRPVRNLRVWATRYQKNGVWVSGLGDLIRALDDTYRWATYPEAAAFLSKAQDQRIPFRGKLQWEAFDVDYFRDKGGDGLTRKSAEEKALRKEATIKGMASFRQAPDGTYLPEVVGPSGATLEARLVLDRTIPSSRRR